MRSGLYSRLADRPAALGIRPTCLLVLQHETGVALEIHIGLWMPADLPGLALGRGWGRSHAASSSKRFVALFQQNCGSTPMRAIGWMALAMKDGAKVTGKWMSDPM